MIRAAGQLLARLRAIHTQIRKRVVDACEQEAHDVLAQPVGDQAGDTVFAIDRLSEDVLLEYFGELARDWPLLLVAEGLGATGQRVLPASATPEIAILVDPIDGTRGLMYQKRPAWILTGVAPYAGALPTLRDIELAVQTEIPLVKQHLCDALWAWQPADGLPVVGGERLNRLTGLRQPLAPRPSRAVTLEHGFGGLARFFPGGRAALAEIDDALMERLLGAPPPGRALAFEDQYICTGGQLYELMMGHDRWVADLRALLPGRPRLACHPYDLSTEFIARAAGVQVLDARGGQLSAPFDVDTAVAWAGFANETLRAQVWPVLHALLREHGWLTD
jgi:hypothetical protein